MKKICALVSFLFLICLWCSTSNGQNKFQSYSDKSVVTTTSFSIVWTEPFPHNNYFLFVRAWTEEIIDGKTVEIQNSIYDFNKTETGFSLKLKKPQGFITYYAVDTVSFDLNKTIFWTDTLTTIATKHDQKQYWSKTEISDADTLRWANSGSGTIVSVNGKTGVVVLDADDISDSLSSQKFTTQLDIDRLANTSGYNSGDQDTTNIPGLKEYVENHSIQNTLETDPIFSLS